ncbi:MAG: class I SAM-dependent methyltransferase, partial [Pyrinomonadaceae bacterium]
AYFDLEQFSQSRILDFGCGCGASTMWLARQFPQSEIVGVELKDDFLAIAKARSEHYGHTNVSFFQSPGGSELPIEMGQFDIVIMSAVYEHLLPTERKVILRKLSSCVRGGGFLFLNQTPNSLFPIELHTTMLPLINYIPDSLAFAAAKRFSKRVEPEDSWDELLRKGIRGATVCEITGNLGKNGSAFTMLEPTRHGFTDRVDLWFSTTNPSNLYSVKKLARVTLKALYKLTGLAMIPDLALAFQKEITPPIK